MRYRASSVSPGLGTPSGRSRTASVAAFSMGADAIVTALGTAPSAIEVRMRRSSFCEAHDAPVVAAPGAAIRPVERLRRLRQGRWIVQVDRELLELPLDGAPRHSEETVPVRPAA